MEDDIPKPTPGTKGKISRSHMSNRLNDSERQADLLCVAADYLSARGAYQSYLCDAKRQRCARETSEAEARKRRTRVLHSVKDVVAIGTVALPV